MNLRHTVLGLLCFLAAGFLVPSTVSAQSASVAASKIEGILYSNLPEAQMVTSLQPYVRGGEKLDAFIQSTKIAQPTCFGTGPGAQICMFHNGLILAVDPDGIIRVIQRKEQTINGVHYSKACIGPCSLTWHGYILSLGNDS